jgi:hypothetical protein
MFEALQTERFALMFSFILGFSLMALLIPVCKGDECLVKKAPSPQEMKKTTYRLGNKCYQFRPETVECPTKGAIEAFGVFNA